MPRQSTWTNADGLVVGFGPHTADNNVPAVTSERNARKTLTFVINGPTLELTGSLTAASIPPQSAVIKRGAYIHSAKLVVAEAFSTGSSPTLTIGTYKVGDITTVDDADGIDATVAATALDTVGEVLSCDGALVNPSSGVATVGATSNSDVVIVAQYGTAAFTTGKGILTIEYTEPNFDLAVVN